MAYPITPASRQGSRLLISAVALLGAFASGVAQTAAENPDEVVTLQEFTVTASNPSEYVAAESITGTRVATKIRDLPFTVAVITSEFMDDFATFEFGEQSGYTSGVVAYETVSTGYSVRGIDANVQLRNGFRRIGLIDKVNVDRVEVIKGAAASIYGTVMPGGTVNIITKKPLAKPEQRLTLSAGSDGLRRVQAASTGPAGDSQKVFYRVDFAAQEQNYTIPYKRMEQWTVVPQLLWKPNQDTSLSIEYEYLRRDEIGNATVPIARTLQTDPWRPNVQIVGYDRLATEVFDFNFAGPRVTANRYVHTATVTFEHRFNRTWSMRSSANWFERGLVRNEIAGRDQYDPLTNSVALGTGRYRPFPEGGGAWQTDFLASWSTGSVGHKTLLTFDYQRQTEKPERWDARTTPVRVTNLATNANATRNFPLNYPGVAAALAALPTVTVSGVVMPNLRLNGIGSTWQYGDILTVLNFNNDLGILVNDPSYGYVTYDEDPSLYSLTQKEDNSLDLWGVFLSHRATFGNRATVLAGVRYDHVENHAISYQMNPDGSLSEAINRVGRTDELSYQIGANVRVANPLSAYVNIARSFVPQFSNGEDIDGNPFDVPNEIGTTKEIGVKASLFGDRLVFTAALFDLERRNVLREARRDEDDSIYDVVNGRETSKGFELDYNWVVTSDASLQFFGQYSYIDSEIHEAIVTPAFNGGPTRRTPRDRVSFGVKFAPKNGSLKGFSMTAGYRYEGKSRGIGPGGRRLRPNTTDVSASRPFVNVRLPDGTLPLPELPEGAQVTSIDRIIYLPDGRESIYNPSYELFEAGIGYSWRTAKRFRHKLQLNIRNLLDEQYTYGSNGQGVGRNWVLSYDVRF